MVQKAKWITVLLVIASLMFGVLTPGRATGTFSDLEGHWVKEKVEDLVAAGIISPGEKFRPREPVTRADFVKMLVLAVGLPQVVSFPPTFSDVRQDQWFYNYVETAAHYGLVKGDSSGRFRPFEGLTREQMASMVMRALGDTTEASTAFLARFKDSAKISSWAKEDVARAVARGILSGTDQGFLFAEQAATRDQAAAVIWRVWQQRTQESTTPSAGEESPTSPAEEATSGGGVTVLGPTRLKVVFPQDLDPASIQAGAGGNFTLVLAGTAFSPGIVTEAFLVSPQEVVLTVPALESGKEYTLSAYDLRTADGQKLSSTPLSFTFRVPADGEAPRLLDANSTGPAGLELTFSEELDATQAADPALYRLRENGASPQTALVSGRMVSLIFAAPLTVGETYTVEVASVQDLWGNRAQTLTSSFTVRADTYPPRLLTARAVSDTAVEAYFNENLAALGSFTLKRNGRAVEIVRAEQVAPGVVRLTAYLGAEGTYALEAQGALDLAGNKTAAARVYFTYTEATGGLEFPPEVEAVKPALARADQVEITFSGPVRAAEAEKVRNYRLTLADDLSSAIEIDEAELLEDGKTVRLTLAEPLQPGASYRYFVSGVEGLNGEEIIPAAGYFVAGSGSGWVTAVAALDSRRLEVRFGQNVVGQYAASNYGLVAEATGRLVPILAIESTGDPRRVVLRLGQDLEEDEDYTLSVGNAITDTFGRALPTFTGSFRARFREAARLRLLTADPVDSRTFRLTFNKPVQEVKVELAGYVFDYEYYDTVVLVRGNKSFKSGESYRLKVWARDRDNPSEVLDWERETLEFDETSGQVEVEEVTAATSQRVKVTFNGPLDEETAADAANYYLREGSSDGPVLRPVRAEYDPARFLVWLYLPTSASLREERYYLTLDGVKDAQGNRFDPDESYRFYGVDTVPPVVVLPYLPNQEGQPLILRSTGGSVTLEGGPGAVEGEAYLRVYLDDRLVEVRRAEEDGSFSAVSLGALSGRHTLRLVVTDTAGNTGERSQVYEF
ncbi:MAG: hypothetical protein PWQ41_1115 [Bacillota bacterium]|jgi:hypothetical protein|nr:hypothetical protein [Bacillota bacterium]MDK2855440.1 hypothetical protein [Bacillota bacterium]MDK2925341.1 hypothetical protein [Bacillota bacterium]